MALVSKNIPNLINGVSQQPAALRLESQGEVQENGFSDVVDGLKKRPPTKFLKKLVKIDNTQWDSPFSLYNYTDMTTPLTETELTNAFFHTYKRSDNIQYQVVITADKVIRVYDIAGSLRYESGVGSWEADGTFISNDGTGTEYANDNTDYLPSDTSYITATSVADATFIVNRNQTVEMSPEIEHEKINNEALVYLKSVNYGRDYTVKVDRAVGDLTATEDTDQQTTNQTSGVVNDNALKVSTIINSLRDSLYAGVAYSVSISSDTEIAYSVSSLIDHYTLADEWADIREIPVPSSDATQIAAGEYIGTDESVIQVKNGSRVFDYDSTGSDNSDTTDGWYWKDANKTEIIVPRSAITHSSFYSTLARKHQHTFTRPTMYLNRITSGSETTLAVQPQDYNDEPFFVLSSISPFDIAVTDDDGGVNLKAFKETAKSFTDLPNQCIPDIRLGVIGDNQKKEDDFHVVFTGGAGQGYWKETTGYDQQNKFNSETMPHTLRQLDNGAFIFSQGMDNDENMWQDRKAGDDNTNPPPSFIGQKITDIFFHRNRLGILAGENVIFSEAGGYLNFWRTTVRTLLDSDPIDVSVSQNEVAELKAAIPIQDNLLLFSDLNQFTLSATQLLTPAEVTIDQSTKYECDLRATPVGAGTSVFFATQSGGFSGVREFFTKDDSEVKDAPEITSHVPKYIQGQIRDLKASSNEDILIALTSDNRNECYVYKWYNSAEERLQSSWSKWKFSKDIVSVYFNNADLYFTFEDGSYEKMELAQADNPVFLDHQFSTANIANVPDDYITSTMIAITEEGYNLGSYDTSSLSQPILDYIDPLGNNGVLIIGEPYIFKYQMSEQVFKPVQGDSTKLARFQLRKMSFNFSNTGKFDVTVDSLGRDPSVATFTGRILGEPTNILGQAAVVPEGSFSVGVQSKPSTTKITITNDTHLPSVFQSAEWEGFVVLRNQRL